MDRVQIRLRPIGTACAQASCRERQNLCLVEDSVQSAVERHDLEYVWCRTEWPN
jgi:hypothetical protein